MGGAEVNEISASLVDVGVAEEVELGAEEVVLLEVDVADDEAAEDEVSLLVDAELADVADFSGSLASRTRGHKNQHSPRTWPRRR